MACSASRHFRKTPNTTLVRSRKQHRDEVGACPNWKHAPKKFNASPNNICVPRSTLKQPDHKKCSRDRHFSDKTEIVDEVVAQGLADMATGFRTEAGVFAFGTRERIIAVGQAIRPSPLASPPCSA
jgi:hypothetical protein